MLELTRSAASNKLLVRVRRPAAAIAVRIGRVLVRSCHVARAREDVCES